MKLLEPGRIGKLALKNRVIMAAMGVSTLEGGKESWGDRMLAYYKARAAGGVGMITSHSVFVSQELEPFTRRSFNLYSDVHLASLQRIVDCLHGYDCKMCVQLTAGFGRVTMRLTPGVAPVSASENKCDRFPDVTARALTTEEVGTLAQAFGKAALRCKQAGVDCIELHGHEGYLLDQFMTALWNRRDDKYGGNRENRLNFTREAIQAIREAVGPDFPIIYRYGVTHYLFGGREMEEGLWITGELEKMGIDAHHVDAGCKENSWWPHPPMYQPLGCMLDISEKVRRISAKPVVAVGRLDRPVIAEKALTDGKADFIALGRGLLADPEWVNKVSNNRIETIIPCIGCHDGCLGAMLHQRPIGCSVNPSCGHEVEWLVTPLKRKKTMLVVGGGPAGIEASRLGIERGFSVTLWEKDSRIGGNLWAAGRPDFKQDIRDYIVYLDGLVRSLPIALQTNKNATPDDLLQQEADHIVIATGAHMGGSLLAAMENMPLISAYDVMNGTSIEGNRIVIMGPGVIGCETALYLARMGKNVSLTMTFPDEELATNLEIRANRDMLLEMMREAGVVVMSHTVPKAIQKGLVIAKRADQELMIPADTVVYAGLMVPNNDLMEPLGKRRSGIIKIGDCLQPGRIIDAVWGAFQAIRSIES